MANTEDGIYVVRQGGRVDYNYREYFLDDESDLENINLEKDNPCPGSIAFIISTSTVYVLNSQKEWIAQGE